MDDEKPLTIEQERVLYLFPQCVTLAELITRSGVPGDEIKTWAKSPKFCRVHTAVSIAFLETDQATLDALERHLPLAIAEVKRECQLKAEAEWRAREDLAQSRNQFMQ